MSTARALEQLATDTAIELGTEAADLDMDTETTEALAELHSMLADLTAACRQTQADIARTLHGRLGAGDHPVGDLTVRVGKPRLKPQWDVDRLLSQVRKAAEDPAHRADAQTGEIVEEPVDALFRLMTEVLPCSPSTSFKAGGIKQLGLDPDDYRTNEWGDPSMSVQRGDR